jgi:hypothetical protein
MAGGTARPVAVCYSVRLSMPRRGDVRARRAVSDDFEGDLARHKSATGVKPYVEFESKRGRDYIRVLAVVTVSAADVAEALDIAWQVFACGTC